MKKGRLHFDRDGIHLVLDSMTGELLEFIRKDTGDNLIKNYMYTLRQPFTLRLANPDGTAAELTPPPHRTAFENPELHPAITSEEDGGSLRITVSYKTLWNGERAIPFPLTYTMTLSGERVTWRLRYENVTDGKITDTRFPVLNGIWLGGSWADDTLIYPQRSGVKYKNPVERFARPPQRIDWRWQEYEYRYLLDGISGSDKIKARGMSGLADLYPGSLSMSWMDYYDADGGLYFGCHDADAHAVRLEAGAFGEENPGISLACSTPLPIASGEAFEFFPVVTAFHRGDWHEAAEIYRAFRLPTLPPMRKHPEWMMKSPGLHAHYDFKYQSGEVVHTYRDIPRLAEEALAVGFHHMLFSGWHKDGFDRGFPCYRYDPDLGTEEEFAAGVAAAKAMGVHVSLYMNIRLHNNAYNPERIPEKAVRNPDGSIAAEGYGSLRFSIMCPGSSAWQDHMAEAVAYAAETYGIDGIYFDQLSSGMRFCYNPAHDHGSRIDAWHRGYQKLLPRVSADYEAKHGDALSLMGEMVCDQNGSNVDFQLNQIFYRYHLGECPEIYRYTFPEHGIIDMLYPEKNMAMRPVHVAQKCRAMMARLFTFGSRFWVYDLVEDNTFTRDPESLAVLKELVAVKQQWLNRFGSGRFLDEIGLTYAHDGDEFLVRRFEADDGRAFLAAFSADASAGRTVTADIPFTTAMAILADGSEIALHTDGTTIALPAVHACVVLLRS
ncbi:MAG: hypothetical protein IJF67_06680 [Clostridia bacterium]|nr:hypothetical protein [Clostridia bacterium]